MAQRKWKHGARGCWWAIVPIWNDPMHPLPWCCGSTQQQAWAMWREWLDERGNAAEWKAVKVFLTEARDG